MPTMPTGVPSATTGSQPVRCSSNAPPALSRSCAPSSGSIRTAKDFKGKVTLEYCELRSVGTAKVPALDLTAAGDGEQIVIDHCDFHACGPINLTNEGNSAPFFRHGPQSGREADKTLSKETLVKLIRPSFGFSKVEVAATGEQGYVASEEIRPASSNLVAAVTPAKVDPLATPDSSPAVEQFNLDSSDPRLVPPPEDLPPAELPAPAPEQ